MRPKLRSAALLSRITFVLVATTLLSVSVYSQNPTGTLRGDVQDPKAARIPSATIVVQARGSSLKRETRSDDHGEFRLSELLPGTYHVTVDAPGFSQAQADVAVVVSSVRDITVTMNPRDGERNRKRASPSLIHHHATD